jgi:ankyrin repeat protein
VLIFAWTTDLHKVADDHRNIAADGLAISQKSLDIQQKEHDQKLSDQEASCLQLFRLTKSTEDTTYEWYKDRIAGRVEGTCMWFLTHPHFQEWKGKESGPLLVSADPGCGKSVLAKYLVDHVLPASSTVCYFFFKDQVQNTVREALCALLHQLFSQKPSLLVHARKQQDKDGADLVNSTSSLWSVFGDAVQDTNAGSVTIVLDALDECVKSETKDLMRHMETQVRNGKSSNAKLKLFMTSRPYEHVVSELHSLSEAFPRIRIPGEDASGTISQEVNCVIQHRVDQFAKDKSLSDEIKACLGNQLLQMEHRTYLWVYLVFDYLEDFRFKRTPKGLASTFGTLPKSVNQAYDQILSKSTDRSMVRKAIAIILAARRPLTLSEMSVAMEVDENTKSIDDLDLEPEHEFKLRLRSWCGLFVSVYHGRIYFLHQTAREFLLAERLSSDTIHNELRWHGFTTMKDAHTALAECCVRFLSFSDASCSLTTDQVQNSKSMAFLEYSASCWSLHLRESKICDDRDAAIAPLTFEISDPNTRIYQTWSRIHWKSSYQADPEFGTRLMVACFFGHIAVAEHSIDKGADVNAERLYGGALAIALSKGHEQIARLLIDKGADVNAQGGYYGSVLALASSEGYEQIARLLIEKGADVNAQGGRYGSVLAVASSKGHEQIARLLIEKGADVNAQGRRYRSALAVASSEGHEHIARLLIDKGADVNAQGRDYGSALTVASSEGHEQIARLLIDKGANVNAQGGVYGSALEAASIKGHQQIARLLIDKGADVNAQGGRYGSALAVASSEGHEQIARLLIEKGADVNAQCGDYGSALAIASSKGQEQIARLLIEKGADVELTSIPH